MESTASLPHWACVAFSAHCAERVLPILDDLWPQCPSEYRNTFVDAIRAARTSASNGQLIDDYPDVDEEVTCLTGSLTLHARGLLDDEAENFPNSPADCRLASEIAIVFAKTSETALAEPGRSFEFAMDGFGWALEVAVDNQQLIDSLKNELRELRECAANERWTHKTRVNWNGMKWVGTPPDRSWWQFWRRG